MRIFIAHPIRFLSAIIFFAGLWFLWPLSSEPPWKEEINPEHIRSLLEERTGNICPGKIARDLDILDPENVISDLLEIREKDILIRYSDSSEPLIIPFQSERKQTENQERSDTGTAPENPGNNFADSIKKHKDSPSIEFADKAVDGRPEHSQNNGEADNASDLPLRGLNILLDPGHHGGAWSATEGRHFLVWALPADEKGAYCRTPVPGRAIILPETASVPCYYNQPVCIVVGGRLSKPSSDKACKIGIIKEGDLNWAVSRLLEEKLASAGANVYLTRGPPQQSAFPEGMDPDFDIADEAAKWLNDMRHHEPSLMFWSRLIPTRIAHIILNRYKEKQISLNPHGLYTRWDLRRRATMAELTNADLTLSIHYNYSRNPVTNQVIVFMPGQIMSHELLTESSRFHALARIVEGDMEITIRLGKAIGSAMHDGMQMPPPPLPVERERSESYLWPLDYESRLFARNLAILRRTPGPVLLLEGPLMNYPDEAALLLASDIMVDGEYYPERLLQYAVAVKEAIVANADLLR